VTVHTRRTFLKGVAAAGVAVAVAPDPAEAAERVPLPPDAVGLLYDSVRCIGCRACVTKCKEANGLPPDLQLLNGAAYDAPVDLNATTKNIIRLARDGERTAFVKGGCMHCADPACVNACMVSAMTKGPGGIVRYDPSLCVGDRYCQIACPFNVPKYEWTNALTPKIVKCELCRHRKEGPACALACPREAIITGKVTDLAKEAHRRIDAGGGRYEPSVYGESEAGGTQVLMLASKEMPFEKLGMPTLGAEAGPARSRAVMHGIYKGAIAPILLYGAFVTAILRGRKQAAGGGKPEVKP
jgi:Fe-S-cluster-containing dehydrogenase component